MNGKSKNNGFVGKLLLSMGILVIMIMFMVHTGTTRQKEYQKTMEESLVAAKEEGTITNFKIEKRGKNFFNCKYKVTIRRDSSAEDETAITNPNFLSPTHKSIEFKF
ncbi:MAG: hypothetical protein ACTH9D_06605 [Enterococcus viikkiensis]